MTSGDVRITGLGFTGSTTACFSDGSCLEGGAGLISLSGVNGSGTFDSARVDHCKFTNITGPSTPNYAVVVGPYWNITIAQPIILFDHITFTTATHDYSFAKFFGSNKSWLADDDWGTNKAYYIEDSTFTGAPGTVSFINRYGVWRSDGGETQYHYEHGRADA